MLQKFYTSALVIKICRIFKIYFIIYTIDTIELFEIYFCSTRKILLLYFDYKITLGLTR